MQHYLLRQRQCFGKNFREQARKLVPAYKLQASKSTVRKSFIAEGYSDYSSPVCYAHLKGMREGFEE